MDAQTLRQTATSKIDQIAQQVTHVLAEHRIDVSLFFFVPSSGDSILSFGTMGDPPDELWDQISGLVCAVIQEAVGVETFRCRYVACALATSDSGAGRVGVNIGARAKTFSGADHMRYSDIEPTATERFRLPISHPILAEVIIDPADWYRFQNLNEDTPATRIVGHEDALDGVMIVYVACASDEVRDRLEDGWG
jgi:hypothetical protein